MGRAKNGELLTNKDQVLFLPHLEQNSNYGVIEHDQPSDQFKEMMELKNICRTVKKGMLKYLKNNKAARSDSIAAKLMKNGYPNLVFAI
jgi:hypothetical protein